MTHLATDDLQPPQPRTRGVTMTRRPNRFEVRGDQTVIFLRRKSGVVLEALIDTSDAEAVLGFPYAWSALDGLHTTYVACTDHRAGARPRTVQLHRWFMGCVDDRVVDHRNGDGVDNRRSNLRIATKQENNRNRHNGSRRCRYKGVAVVARSDKFQARLHVEGKLLYLGLFSSEEEAAHAYNVAALAHFGAFAALNVIETEVAS